MEIRNKINEKHFNLEIYEWDDFTLDLLKSYSDWKCNGKQVPVTIEKRLETDNQPCLGQKDPFSTMLFPGKQPLAKASEYGNTPIHSSILEYILKSIPDKFTKKNVYEPIYDFYKEGGREIKLTSARVYGDSYCGYMLDKKIITEVDGGFAKVKKNQS